MLGEIVQRIRRSVEAINRDRELPIPLSFSAGWSLWTSPAEPFEEVLEEADRMMYLNKFSR